MSARAAHIRGCLLYFFLFCAYGSIQPFMPLIWRGKGLSEHQIGVIGSIVPLASFFATPILCSFADRHRVQRQMLLAALLSYPLARSSVLIAQRFLAVSAVEIASAVLKSPIGSLIDAFVIHSAGTDGYGNQRLWGAVGFGVATLVGGTVSDVSGGGFGGVMLVFVAMIAISIPLMRGLAVGRDEKGHDHRASDAEPKSINGGYRTVAVDDDGNDGDTASDDHRQRGGLVSDSVEDNTSSAEHRQEVQRHDDVAGAERAGGDGEKAGGGVVSALKIMLGSRESASFFGAVGLSGMGAGVIDTFLFIRVEELGGSHVLCGTARLIMCLAEVPFFYLSGPLIRKIGVRWVIALTEVAYLVRFIYYSNLERPWWVLPVEVLHGLTFAAMWAATTDYAYQISPAGQRSTIQGLVTGVHWGFGFGFGAIGGGMMYKGLGAKKCFLVSSALPTMALVLLCLPAATALCKGRGKPRRDRRKCGGASGEYELISKGEGCTDHCTDEEMADEGEDLETLTIALSISHTTSASSIADDTRVV